MAVYFLLGNLYVIGIFSFLVWLAKMPIHPFGVALSVVLLTIANAVVYFMVRKTIKEIESKAKEEAKPKSRLSELLETIGPYLLITAACIVGLVWAFINHQYIFACLIVYICVALALMSWMQSISWLAWPIMGVVFLVDFFKELKIRCEEDKG